MEWSGFKNSGSLDQISRRFPLTTLYFEYLDFGRKPMWTLYDTVCSGIRFQIYEHQITQSNCAPLPIQTKLSKSIISSKTTFSHSNRVENGFKFLSQLVLEDSTWKPPSQSSKENLNRFESATVTMRRCAASPKIPTIWSTFIIPTGSRPRVSVSGVWYDGREIAYILAEVHSIESSLAGPLFDDDLSLTHKVGYDLLGRGWGVCVEFHLQVSA